MEPFSFVRAKRGMEESGSVSTTTTITTTTSFSTGHLVLEIGEDDGDEGHEDSVIPRPVNHVDNNCFCYENREDCTTCSTQYTDDSEIFMLTSSESRSQAGSSSEDGSSIFSLEPTNSFDDSSGFSLVSGEEGDTKESYSELSNLEPGDYTVFIENLRTKKVEFHEDFIENSTKFGQLMALHGYQRAVLEDRILDLKSKITDRQFLIHSEKDSFEEPMEFHESELTRLFLERCHLEHSEVRNGYLKSLMDEDIMKSNLVRIEELKEMLNRWRTREEQEEEEEEEEEDWEKILDDVSTCRSFCPDDV